VLARLDFGNHVGPSVHRDSVPDPSCHSVRCQAISLLMWERSVVQVCQGLWAIMSEP
jgi:hypothetical protein